MKRDDLIGLGMVLVVIVLIAAFFIFAKNAPQLAYGPVEIIGSTIDVMPVQSDTEVDVNVNTVKAGFVTIHESIGGAPGPMVGVSNLIPEKHGGVVQIFLTKPMTPSMPYVALLHVDNGDGQFIVKDDQPVTSDGKSVRADFTSPGLKK